MLVSMMSPTTPMDEIDQWPAKPPGAAVAIVKDGGGFVISAGHVPRGSVPLAYFAIGVFGVGIILLASFLLVTKFAADIAKHPAEFVPFSLFWILGLPASFTAMYWGIQMAFSKSVFIVTRDTLIYRRKGPLGSRKLSWPLAEVRKLQVANSMVIRTSGGGNSMPPSAILITSNNGRSKEVLTAHKLEELEWVRTVLGMAIKIVRR